MLVRQLAGGVGFVQLFHQPIQFNVTLFRLDNLLPAILGRFFLAQTGRFPDTLDKLLLIIVDIPAYPLGGGEDCRFQLLRWDISSTIMLLSRAAWTTSTSFLPSR